MSKYDDAVKKYFPLSSSQLRYWSVNPATCEAILSNISLGVKLRGRLDLDKLYAALKVLVEIEPILRIKVDEKQGNPRQCIESIIGYPIPYQTVDLQSSEASTLLEIIISEHLAQPFNFDSLWKFIVIQLPDNCYHLVLIMHRLIADNTTLESFYHKLSNLYLDNVHNKDSHFSIPSFLEFASVQSENAKLDSSKEAETYWNRQLNSDLPILDLPYDEKPLVDGSYKGRTQIRVLKKNQLDKIKSISTAFKTTYGVFLIAAFYVLLYRITSQKDFIIMGTFPGREKLKSESFGYYDNAIPMRFREIGFDCFKDLLISIDEIVSDSLDHRYYSFEKMHPFNKSGKKSQKSVLSTHFRICNDFGSSKKLFGIFDSQFIEHWHLRKVSEFDLLLQSRELDGELQISFDYNSECLDEKTIERFFYAYEQIIAAMSNNISTSINDVDIISYADRKFLLEDCQGLIEKYPDCNSYLELFEKQVSNNPQAIAVKWNNESLTYDALNKKANRIANYLRQLGVASNQLVGLSHPRTPDMIVSLIAILKAGGAYVPLDYRYPLERLTYIIREAKIKIVISTKSVANNLPISQDLELLLIDDLSSELEMLPEQNLITINKPNDLAYTIFTSGSTGNPKGVPISHISLINLMFWGREYFSAEEFSGFFSGSSVGFDASVFELLTPLAWGGTIILAENILHFGELPNYSEVVVLTGTPSGIASILRAKVSLPKSLKTVVLLGEGVPRDLVESLYQFPHIQRVVNAYGLTEITVHSIVTTLKKNLRVVPIGKPLPNTRVFILDSNRKLVPPGIIGEIYIGGVGLSQGFLNRPDLTSERFFDDPFDTHAKGRLYKTGDLGRYNNEGEVEYFGRNDFQIKIRGYRLELEEIETILRTHLAIDECVVSVQKDNRNENRLVAYFTSLIRVPSNDELKDFLGKKLPDFMIPNDFILVNDIPKSFNGKVDRKSFCLSSVKQGEEENILSLKLLEEVVCRVWKEILKIDSSISEESNFFELGGYSLLIPKLQAAFKKQLGITTPVADFFYFPSVKSFSKKLYENNKPLLDIKKNEKECLIQKSVKSALTCNSLKNDIAIIGVACRLPETNTAMNFWQRVCEGKSLITRVPDERWNWQKLKDGQLSKTYGAFLSNIDQFDAGFFRISKPEARWLDPQQRLLLEVIHDMFSDAGYQAFDLTSQDRKTAVFVGASFSDYARLIERYSNENEPYAILNNSLSFLANRVSYTFGLCGPSLAIDTGCSSSLVAVHSAVECLRQGNVSMAIASGVFLMLIPDNLSSWSQMGILARNKESIAFDVGANGFIPGEAVVSVLLKRSEDAIRDGDNILAIIKGTAVNQDGNNKFSMTATSPKAQTELLLAASQDAGVSLDTISFVETHGTGTALGDAVEFRGLVDAFRKHTGKRGICAIGAVKSIYGHSGPAAGLVGMLKCIMALHHRTLPPMLSRQPNPEIVLEDSPFYINSQLRKWDMGQFPRRAGVSAFGFGGTNAHVILEESSYPKLYKGIPYATYNNRERYWFPMPQYNTYDEKWFYKKVWKPISLEFQKRLINGPVIMFSDKEGICSVVAEKLLENAKQLIQVFSHQNINEKESENQWYINCNSEQNLESFIERINIHSHTELTIVYGWALNNSRQVVDRLFLLLKVIGKKISTVLGEFRIRFVILMHDLKDSNENYLENPIVFGSQGLINAARHEFANIDFQTLYFNEEALLLEDIGKIILNELMSVACQKEILHSHRKRFESEFSSVNLENDFSNESLCKKDGVYLISGGLIGIGRVVAEWLLREYNAKVIVFSRTGAGDNDVLLKEFPNQIWLTKADVTNIQSINELHRESVHRFGKIDGVFHLAAITKNNPIIKKTPVEFNEVFNVKSEGAIILDSVLKKENLDFMVLFSSVAGLYGNIFQCDYSAANSFLDAFAHWRNTLGRRTISISWGTWSDIGAAFRAASLHFSECNFDPDGGGITAKMGLEMLKYAMRIKSSHIIAANMEYFEELNFIPEKTHSALYVKKQTTNKKEQIENWLHDLLAEKLSLDKEAISLTQPFLELGVDSIMAMRLVNSMNKVLQIQLPRTLFFIQPNIQELSVYLGDKLTGQESIFQT